jgi:hypothetical protein
MFAAACSPWVGIRSKTMRRPCRPLVITLISLAAYPASYCARPRPSRSSIASLATCSASVSGSMTSSSAIVRRVSSAWASKPAGDRSSNLSSWPGMPTKVAPVGLSGAHSAT